MMDTLNVDRSVVPNGRRPSTGIRIGRIQYKTSREFRQLIKGMYPDLDQGNSAFRWRMMQYLIWGIPIDPVAMRFLVPWTLIRQMDGRTIGGNRAGWNADRLLESFCEVLPLEVSDYRYVDGRCRTMRPLWSEEQYAAIRDGAIAAIDKEEGYFPTGEPVYRRQPNQRRQREEGDERSYERVVQEAVADSGQHPAQELLEFPNNQSDEVFKRFFSRNRIAVLEAVLAMPATTKAEQARQGYAARVYRGIVEAGCVMQYHDSPRTARLWASGVNVTQLPRELRKIALRGTTQMDLASIQLAIVARLYECPQLLAFFGQGSSIWPVLLEWMGLGAEHKQIVKTTIYSLTFGMCKERMIRQLATGYVADDDRLRAQIRGRQQVGVGVPLARRFFRNTFVQELLERRSIVERRVRRIGVLEDAWGNPIRRTFQRSTRSVMAAQAQSYEVKIMASLLPVIRSTRTRIACWLHDGIYCAFDDQNRKQQVIAAMQNAVSAAAEDMGIVTRLDVEDML